ncbi:hypothetical protein [Haladaptatus sp. DFWS20]|uniref:hypothetical protein n=1 Tax=Haladaptatus sp. DFWS20 TaxID=3403467 RepID=UPI003EB90810
MVDWLLIRRSTLRYSLGYALPTVALAAGIAVVVQSSILLFAPLVGGAILLLFVLGGTGKVRMGPIGANAESPGLTGTVIAPNENNTHSKPLTSDVKLLFYGLGLCIFGLIALVAVGMLSQSVFAGGF